MIVSKTNNAKKYESNSQLYTIEVKGERWKETDH